MDGRQIHKKRHRTLISCTECHRRKQKCDRRQPCQNCVKRCKPELCRFERPNSGMGNGAAARATPEASTEGSHTHPEAYHPSQLQCQTNQLSGQDRMHLTTVLGYSTHNAYTTLGLVDKVWSSNPSTISSLRPSDVSDVKDRKQTALDDKYRSLIRMLPSTMHTDVLVAQFFSEINWQYDVLDEITFRGQVESWRLYPYPAQTQASSCLPADLLAFPSLAAQVIAHSLIHQPAEEQRNSSLESLKYVSGMSFVDLAHELSDAGHSTLQAIKKKDLSVVAVQSGLLRTSFLKSTGNVIEAWHVLGATIRNAQEIGLHVNVAARSPSTSADAQWDHEMRRKVWFMLHNWDIHMAVVLGRPITTTMMAGTVHLPGDFSQREHGEVPRIRTYPDAPTPLSVIRIGYDTAYQYFPQIHQLENRGAKVEDYSIVQETHAAITRNIDSLPCWCRHENPDKRFDGSPSCRWLPAARHSLTSGLYFVLLSLHRPYIFSIRESRSEALKAARIVVTTQTRLFHMSELKQYLAFSMVYPLFDAMVVSLAILILFPNENLDVRLEVEKGIHCGIEILAKVGQHNAMAQSANSVLTTLIQTQEQYRHSPQHLNRLGDRHGRASRSVGATDLPAFETVSDTMFMPDNSGTTHLANSSTLLSHEAYSAAPAPCELDAGTLLPPRPISDLFHQNVYAPIQEDLENVDIFANLVQLNSDNSDENFWRFMNDLNNL